MEPKASGILGCYLSQPPDDTNAEYFRKQFLWSENGFADKLRVLKSEKYGTDIELILIEFYINPDPDLKQHIEPITRYRPKEKSIAITIILEDNDFFKKPKKEWQPTIRQIVLERLNGLSARLRKSKKLDTDMQKLIEDVGDVLIPETDD
jgi:hypothetical protein